MTTGPKVFDIKEMMSNLESNYKIEGSLKIKIIGVGSLEKANPNHLAFCSSDGNDGIKLISQSNAGIILCKKTLEGFVHPKQDRGLVFLNNPQQAFLNILKKTFGEKKVGISRSALISKRAEIGDECYIGDYVVIGDNCKVGENTIIYDRVSLLQDCIIGSDCVIQSGAVLGDEGHAYERYPTRLERFPHIGSLIIGNHVEIGANAHISRGSLSDTVIGNNTKIDTLVHIGHNTVIGEYCQIVAGASIGGSVAIGNSTWIGINASVKQKVKIGDNVIVGMGASVISDVLDNEVVAGVPAKSIKNKVTLNSDKRFRMIGKMEDEKKSVGS